MASEIPPKETEKTKRKYQKRRRGGGGGGGVKNKPVLFLSLLCLLLFGVYIWRSHVLHKAWHDRQHTLQRAKALMKQRFANSFGGKSKAAAHNQARLQQDYELDEEHDARGAKGRFFKMGHKGEKKKKEEAVAEFGDGASEDEESVDLEQLFAQINHDIRSNAKGGIRWIPPKLLKELPDQPKNTLLLQRRSSMDRRKGPKAGFRVGRRGEEAMAWQLEWEQMSTQQQMRGPKVDYTKHKYEYPEIRAVPDEDYPPLETMKEMLGRWPQDGLDNPPETIVEQLMHFNYSNPKERKMAEAYREAKLPFKVYDVPEVLEASFKWTDEYVAQNFDPGSGSFLRRIVKSSGQCQESVNNFFAFFTPVSWILSSMGPPPTRNNDWSYKLWSQHARYADAVGLDFDQPHFYFQSGVPKEERFSPQSRWTFVSRDLPSFSSPTDTFFAFHVDSQKGIQCRFGERGVTAATHYDAGQNMVAMVRGAKRYILSPPRECSKLGIVTARGNSIFRHSLLNFAHISHLDNPDGETMSREERAWLERAASGKAVDTVLKSGEVLFIPSHWFHYITSLQKSAQCNVRSGVDEDGTRRFGGAEDVYECQD